MKLGFMTEFLMENTELKKNLLQKVVGENVFIGDAGYHDLLENVTENDCVVLYEAHDLADDWPIFVHRWNELKERHIPVEVVMQPAFNTIKDENTSWVDDILSITQIGYEMNNFYLNQKKISGMKKAKANGVKFGRRKVENPKEFVKYYHLWKEKKLPIKDAAAAIGMNTSTFFRHCREYTEELESR